MRCRWVRGGGLEVRVEDPLIEYQIFDLGNCWFVMFVFHAGRYREPLVEEAESCAYEPEKPSMIF